VKIKRIFATFIISVTTALILSLISAFGFLESWQNKASDHLFTQRPVSQDIILISIDDKSIQKIGRWPWGRFFHAKLIDKIKNAKLLVMM